MRRSLLLATMLVACGGQFSVTPTPDGGATRSASQDAGDTLPPSRDGGTSLGDGGLDGADAGSPDPLAACGGSRDVFYANWGPNADPSEGSLGAGTATYTNLDAPWQVNWQLPSPLSITAASLNLEITPLSNAPLVPGIYTVGAGAVLDVGFFLQGDGCYASGTLSIAELQTTNDGTNDGGTEQLSSLLMSFNLDCLGPVQGCIRYSTTWDPVAPIPDGGLGDGGLLSPCESGGDVFYVDSEGEGDGGLPDGPRIVTGAQGIWNGNWSGDLYDLDVAADSDWHITTETASLQTETFEPGTYESGGHLGLGPYLQVEVAGVACASYPLGTFTVAEIPSSGSGLLLGFDMQCNGGRRRGCVSYGN